MTAQKPASVLSEEDHERLREIASSDDKKASHLIKVRLVAARLGYGKQQNTGTFSVVNSQTCGSPM